MKFHLQKKILWLLATFPLLFLLLFYFYPLGTLFWLSFTRFSQNSSLFTYWPNYAAVLGFTFGQALVSTLLTVGLALPGAYLLAHYQFWGKTTLRTLSTLPFVLPTVVVANAFSALLGRNGLLNEWLMAWGGWSEPPIQLQQTIWLIWLAHLFYNYSVPLRMISSYWANLPPHLTEAAALLGASPGRVFWQITWPLLRPVVMASALVVFIFCFTSFGVVLILGGPQFATLEVEIYVQTTKLFNLPLAATLSLLQIGFTLGFMLVYTHLQRRLTHPFTVRASQSNLRPVNSWPARLLLAGNLWLMGGLLGAPLLALVVRSFSGREGLTLYFYQQLWVNERGSIFFVPPGEAIFNSAGFALATVLLAVPLGLTAVWLLQQNGWFSRLLDALFMLPLATSAVTLGFGFIVALDKPPLNLRSSLWLVPIAHTLVALPLVIRAVLPAVRRLSPRLAEAGFMLGATPWQTGRYIIWPLIRPAVLVGVVFAFTVSMGEFGATLFIARPETPTLPTAIFRFLGQPGAVNYGQALAMSTLLMGVCAAGFLLIERLRLGDEGEF